MTSSQLALYLSFSFVQADYVIRMYFSHLRSVFLFKVYVVVKFPKY